MCGARQHAVDHLKVAYMPPLEDIGPDPLAVRFVFSVSDRRGGGAVADLDFNITVTPVDDQPPEVTSSSSSSSSSRRSPPPVAASVELLSLTAVWRRVACALRLSAISCGWRKAARRS